MQELFAAIGKLTEIQQKRLKKYYFEGLKLREIAEADGVTHERVEHSLRVL
ncbi:sigma factor-like helix-turn-helix DNA-binding protein [Desulfoscipio gibsoniae]|uniref:sigma factor-like helix-turn-helix DNA-binding protein n=1 Tax=Desulfoscipio gibsoniae TaxID=102134 RepID=UPI00338F55CA